MVSIKPLGNRIVIKPKKAAASIGGILLPETAQQKPKEGTVVAVGPGKVLDNGQRSKPSVNEGDLVLFSSYAGHEITYKGEDYIILAENDILGSLESEESSCGCKGAK